MPPHPKPRGGLRWCLGVDPALVAGALKGGAGMPPALFTHFSIVSAARPRAVDLIGQLYINTYHYTSLYTPFVAGGLLGGAGDGAGAPAGGAARVPPDVGDKRHGLPDPVFISDIYVYIMIYINIQPRGQTPRPSRSGVY